MTIQSVCLVDVNGNVQNAIALENDPTSINYSPYTPPAGLTMQVDPLQQAGIGWTYAGGVFTNPNAGQ